MAHHGDTGPTQRSLERLDEGWVRKFCGIAKQLLRATVKRKGAAQNPAQLRDAAQNPTQQPAANAGSQRKGNRAGSPENADALVGVGATQAGQDGGMGDEGIEPSTAALRVRCSAN
jgi:hypothetical protein